MEGVSPTSELGVGVTLGDSLQGSPTLDAVAHCNLNDLQSYLVNFNKEIEGNDGTVSFQNFMTKGMASLSSASTRPVFVTLPVSSESSTPDDEQLPVMTDIKVDKPLSVDSNMSSSIVGNLSSGNLSLCDGETATDQMVYVKMDAETELLNRPGVTQDDKDSVINFTDQAITVEDTKQNLEDIPSDGRVELSLEQIPLGLNNQLAVSDGMVMLQMGDVNSLLANTDPRLLQIVNINGQPTLQLVGATNLLPQAATNPGIVDVAGVEGQSTLLAAQPSSLINTSNNNQMTLLTTPVTNNPLLNTIQANPTIQLTQQVNNASPQLVAVQEGTGSAQAHVMALNLEDILPAPNQPVSLATPMKRSTGYQSVAILPSGDSAQQEDVSYVLIVNPAGDGDKIGAGPMYDFGNNVQGEVVEEMVEENGLTKRLVKLNRLPVMKKDQGVSELMLNAGDELACNVCEYTSPQRYLLKRHMKSHSVDRPHKCGYCQRGFKSMSSLQNHINTHTGVRPHKCKMCESAFTTSGELVRHMRYKHTFEKPHKCKVCEYASVELSKMKRHMRSHTGERPYKCQYCNYASPDTYKLKRHLRIHTGEKPYQCEICNAKFTQSNSLKAHRLIHSGNKPVFQCSLCPATCGRSSDLKVHVQKLHGVIDKPLVCKKCNARCADRYSFKMHLKTHEGERCFKCPECEYAAITQRHLDTHMLTHSGIKPFECVDCDLAFRQKQQLKNHRLLYHNPACNPVNGENGGACKECEKNYLKKGAQSQQESDADVFSDTEADTDEQQTLCVHTCGGFPKSQMEIAPLTSDQLIQNSLLADMKEGKLGTSPKVVVVHPDGRVEEVTAKLQSLSQSKPMDDFLVSLGVTGDSQFDQVTSLPSDVAEVNGLMSEGQMDGASVLSVDEDTVASVIHDCEDPSNKGNYIMNMATTSSGRQVNVADVLASNALANNVVCVTVQQEIDEESDVDVEEMHMIPQLTHANVPHVTINVPQPLIIKRELDDLEEESDIKRLKLSTI